MAASLQRIGVVICRTFPGILQRNFQTQVGYILMNVINTESDFLAAIV